jgi:cytoskeleton protein RodZ
MSDATRLDESSAAADLTGTRTASTPLAVYLREARERSGLSLGDLAEVTHVRRVYLAALEEARYADLPEDVYTRNFLRLYAQAVGLGSDDVMDRYVAERRAAGGLSTMAVRLDTERRAARSVSAAPIAPAPRRRPTPPTWLVGPWLPTLVLVGLVVGLGLWGFNQLFARPVALPAASPPAAAEPVDAADAAAAESAPEATLTNPVVVPSLTAPGAGATLGQVRVDIVTTPPGASITIDGFPIPGRTPLAAIPVTGREGRVVRAELDGHDPVETVVDLRSDTRIELALAPFAPTVAAGAEAIAATTPPAAPGGAGQIVFSVTEASWLEIYRSTARNVGDRLVFTTAQPGASYTFAPPLYVHVGNAAGVRVNRNGQDLGPMGAPGAVLGRAFAE